MPVRRARRSWGVLLVPGLVLLLASGLTACGGSADDDASPAPSEAAPQAAIAVESPEPPSPAAETSPADFTPTDADALAPDADDRPSPAEVDATVSAVATPDTSPASTEADAPPPIVSLTAALSGPAVPVTGPLIVVSEDVRVWWDAEGQAIETRRVFLMDRVTGRYWPAFDYHNATITHRDFGIHTRRHLSLRSAVQPAGRHLIVWATGQVARLSLGGQIEAVLLEDAAIRAVQVSPDGSHVAILYGWPGTVLVLETATGAERLRLTSDDPEVLTGSTGALYLGTWHADGDALSITTELDWTQSGTTTILRLDGSLRVLPDDWVWLSSDLRFALRFGEHVAGYGQLLTHDRWEVIHVATGAIRWVIVGDEGGVREPWWATPWLRLRQSRYLAFSLPAADGMTNRILDTATGEISPLPDGFWRMLAGPLARVCENPDHSRPSLYQRTPAWLSCDWYDDGVGVWEGNWETEYHGQIAAAADGRALAGIALQEVPRAPVPPSPPAREAMVGPLLLYSVKGDYVPEADGTAAAQAQATRRVIAYDDGTGQDWLVLTYRVPGVVQAAHGGIVAALDQGLLYVTPDGQVRVLADQQLEHSDFRVAPDGRQVVARLSAPDRFVVFALPAGAPTLEVAADTLIGAAGLDLAATELHRYAYGRVEATLGNPGGHGSYWRAGQDAWTADATAIRIFVVAHGHDAYLEAFDVTVTLEGAIDLMASDRDGGSEPPILSSSSPAFSRCPDVPGPRRCRIRAAGHGVVGEGRWPYIIGEVALD